MKVMKRKWIVALSIVVFSLGITSTLLLGYAISAYFTQRAQREQSNQYDALIIGRTNRELEQGLNDIHKTLSTPAAEPRKEDLR